VGQGGEEEDRRRGGLGDDNDSQDDRTRDAHAWSRRSRVWRLRGGSVAVLFSCVNLAGEDGYLACFRDDVACGPLLAASGGMIVNLH
jgi:hypothetical protein